MLTMHLPESEPDTGQDDEGEPMELRSNGQLTTGADAERPEDPNDDNSGKQHVNGELPRSDKLQQDADENEEGGDMEGEFDLDPAPMTRGESMLPQCPCLVDDAQGELSKDTITHVQAGVPQHLLWLVGVVMRQEKSIAELSAQLQLATTQIADLKQTVDSLSAPLPSGLDTPYRRGLRLPVPPRMGVPVPEVISMRIPGRQGLTYTRRWLLANRPPVVADSAATDLHINVNLFPGAFTTEPVITDKNGYVFPSSSASSSSFHSPSSSSPNFTPPNFTPPNFTPRRFGEDRWDHNAFAAERTEQRPMFPRMVYQKEPRGRQDPRKPKEPEPRKMTRSETAWKPPALENLSAEEALGRQILPLLNKLTFEKFDAVSAKIIDVLKSVEEVGLMQRASEVIFEKAIAEKHFAPIYGKLCQTIRKAAELKHQRKELAFAFQLLGRCQKEFESFRPKPSDSKEPNELTKKRFLGMAIFLGELYKYDIVKDVILRGCINGLLKELNGESEESIEGLCQLLETAGARLELDEKNQVPSWFDAIKVAAANQLSSARLRFMLQNLVELRERRWIPRVAHEEVKTLDEIHKDHARPHPPVHSRDPRSMSDRDSPSISILKNPTRNRGTPDVKPRRKVG